MDNKEEIREFLSGYFCIDVKGSDYKELIDDLNDLFNSVYNQGVVDTENNELIFNDLIIE